MPLISAAELDAFRHSDSPPRILDASWHLPAAGRNARKEFAESHLPGADFMDLDLFCDPLASLPNTLSKDIQVTRPQFEALGIHAGQSVVLYDRSDLHSACRAYWIFRLWGFPAEFLYILDGGMKAWDKQGFILSSGIPQKISCPIAITFQSRLLASLAEIKQLLRAPSAQIIDLRHPVRYAGGPEPRGRAGHIPGSFCYPSSACFNAEGCFLPFEKISQRLQDIGVDLSAPLITTCGSGMTAPILNFVLDCLSHPTHSLYDGSWAEWGADQCFPGESSLTERPVETSLQQGPVPQPA